jgi:tetratricopeptide (TPR) repeat protein
MKERCPRCRQPIPSLADGCDMCGWHIGLAIEEGSLTNDLEMMDVAIGQSKSTVETTTTPSVPAEPMQPVDPAIQLTSIEMNLDSAHDAIERNDYTEAIHSLNRAMLNAEGLQLAQCYSLRAYAHLQNGQCERAIDDCDQAIMIRGAESDTLECRAAARGQLNQWKLAFDDLMRVKQFDQPQKEIQHRIDQFVGLARQSLNELIKQDPSSSKPWLFERGWVYCAAGQTDKARRDFQQMQQRNPKHALSLVGLARLCNADQEFDDAIVLCTKAISLDDNCKIDALTCRVQAYKGLGNMALAIADVEQLESLANGKPLLAMDCAHWRSQLGDYVGAIEAFGKIIRSNPLAINAWRGRGDAYAQMRNFSLAIRDYTHYLEQQPDQYEILIARGKIYFEDKRYIDALADFDQALEINDVCLDAMHARAKVWMKQAEYDKALAECEKILRLDSHRHDVLATRGAIYFEMKKYGRAALQYDSAISNTDDPLKKAGYLYQRGVNLYQQERFDKAIDDFRAAIAIQPQHSGASVWRAAAAVRLDLWPEAIEALHDAIASRQSAAHHYHELGKPAAEKAVEHFSKQLSHKQTDGKIYRYRGLAFQFLGHAERAIDDFTVALNFDRSDHRSLIYRGRMQARMGLHDASIADFTRALRINENDHFARYSRAMSLLAQGKLNKAAQDIDKAIEISHNHARYHVLKGEIYYHGAGLNKAVASLTKAIALDCTDTVAFRLRGTCLLNQGHNLKAIADFTRCLELDPRQPELFSLRGQAYLRNGQSDMANADFEMALTHDPKLVKAFCGRSQVFVIRGEHEKALIWLTKAIHRFDDSRDLSQLLMARGKIFYQMGRFAPAISDFATVLEMQRVNAKAAAAARCARAIALVQLGELTKAEEDFQKVLSIESDHIVAQESMAWLQEGTGPRPKILQPPTELIRPTRPPQAGKPIELNDDPEKWNSPPPFDLWLVRTEDKREYGPVTKSMLDSWVRQGRIRKRTRLLRSDWKRWKRADFVYPELAPPKIELPTQAPEVELDIPIIDTGGGKRGH